MFLGHLFLLLVTCFYVEQCQKCICSAIGFWMYEREAATANKQMNKRRTTKNNLSQYSDSCLMLVFTDLLLILHWKQKGLGSIPLRLYFLFKKVVVCGQFVVILSLTINETLKWPSSLPIIMQESFWWWQCSNRYIIISSLFPPPSIPPSPLFPVPNISNKPCGFCGC